MCTTPSYLRAINSTQFKAILLVGGFGSSAYLKKRLQETNFGSTAPEIIQAVNACTAIVS